MGRAGGQIPGDVKELDLAEFNVFTGFLTVHISFFMAQH